MCPLHGYISLPSCVYCRGSLSGCRAAPSSAEMGLCAPYLTQLHRTGHLRTRHAVFAMKAWKASQVLAVIMVTSRTHSGLPLSTPNRWMCSLGRRLCIGGGGGASADLYMQLGVTLRVGVRNRPRDKEHAVTGPVSGRPEPLPATPRLCRSAERAGRSPKTSLGGVAL